MVKHPRSSYRSFEVHNAVYSSIRLVLWLTLFVFVTSGAALAVERHLVMAVVVNGRDIDQVGDFTQRDTQLFATRKDLLAFGLLLPGPSSGKEDELVCLDTLAEPLVSNR